MSSQLVWTLILIACITIQSIMLHNHLDDIEKRLQDRIKELEDKK